MKGGKRLAVLAGGLGSLVAALLVLLVGVVGVVVFLGGGDDKAPTASADDDCGGSSPAVPVLDPGPRVATLTAEQTLEKVFAETPEADLIDQAIERRVRLRGRPQTRQESKSLFDHLLRRGFSIDLVVNKVRALSSAPLDEEDGTADDGEL